MAGIATGGKGGGKKSVDHEIPLVPFIDLLLCCIMFLLVTAVWNQLSSMDAYLDAPGNPQSEMDPPTDLPQPLMVRVSHDGFTLSTALGDEVEIPKVEDAYDLTALREHLSARRRLDPNRTQALVSADDGVTYAQVMDTMDALAGHGFPHVTVSGR
ncbi:MAG TPA: biopolymer transporter ExbD [Sandaracinaceae bacterium LLY-WYZ-13_1]|nr:biopolymer transporter ExbD [Sandaracinaceae bacterium LLY-WYZ-13_1]